MNSAKYVKVDNTLEKVADAAKSRLIEDYNITIPQSKAIATFAYLFLKEIVREANQTDEEINVLEMFGIQKVDGEAKLSPGQELKLIVKDDE